MDLKQKIKNIENFPVEGVTFRDITTLIQDPDAFKFVTEEFAKHISELNVDMIAVLDARGFLFGAPVAFLTGKGLVPIRKRGKLPRETYQVEYALEYGTDVFEMHKDAVLPGMKVAIFDDLLATGGTSRAACQLVEKAGGEVVTLAFVIELTDLCGRDKLKGYDIYTMVQY